MPKTAKSRSRKIITGVLIGLMIVTVALAGRISGSYLMSSELDPGDFDEFPSYSGSSSQKASKTSDYYDGVYYDEFSGSTGAKSTTWDFAGVNSNGTTEPVQQASKDGGGFSSVMNSFGKGVGNVVGGAGKVLSTASNLIFGGGSQSPSGSANGGAVGTGLGGLLGVGGGIGGGGISIDGVFDGFSLDTGNISINGGSAGGSSAQPGCGEDSNCMTVPEASVYKGIAIETSFREFLIKWTNFFLGFLTLIAMIALIYAGFLYVTAGGNDEQVNKAKKTVIWVVMGIIIILLAYALVNTLITTGPKGDDQAV